MTDEPNNLNEQINSEPITYSASQVSDEDKFWLLAGQNSLRKSIDTIEDAAKQLISINTFAQTIYFASISFSNIKSILSKFSEVNQWLIAVGLLLPIISWIFSLIFAVLAFTPKYYTLNIYVPSQSKAMLRASANSKFNRLRIANIALFIGFIFLAINLLLYLKFFPFQQSK